MTKDKMSELSGPISNAAAMPGSSKDAHELVPSLIDGIARKIIEMDAPIANAMISLALIVRIIDALPGRAARGR